MQKITKEKMFGQLKVVGYIKKIEWVESSKKGNSDTKQLHIKLNYGQTGIFIYEEMSKFQSRMEKYKINDVIEVVGNFVATWYTGARSSLPVINQIISVKKIGIYQDEKNQIEKKS